MTTSRPIITLISFCLILLTTLKASAIDNRGITSETPLAEYFPLITTSGDHALPTPIVISDNDLPGIEIAASNLSDDFRKVCGTAAQLIQADKTTSLPSVAIMAGSLESSLIRQLIKSKRLNETDLKGKYEKYVMTTVDSPMPGVDRALVIAGSDRRGTIYGIYELSEQIGVSPWYDWADVPPARHDQLYIADGSYTAGEPAVKYRGIFLNDEAPCLTGWVKNT